eukprot:TRINITY_DN47526_c0_g2_i1.p2 TRINITY_DN47526_c0_g2~~TRINITY_DN47526_c0_g2_i1.p2  ORF type:complete len:101 (+),score=2.14 TRINITY_DN47526_c0_g2_i1:183-485(+)
MALLSIQYQFMIRLLSLKRSKTLQSLTVLDVAALHVENEGHGKGHQSFNGNTTGTPLDIVDQGRKTTMQWCNTSKIPLKLPTFALFIPISYCSMAPTLAS